MYLIQPILIIRLLWRSRISTSHIKRLLERYGFCKGHIKPHGVIIHAVSVGETMIAISIASTLRNQYPSLPIVITSTTLAASQQIVSKLGEKIYHYYLPYDLFQSMERFLDKINPRLIIIIETELWPNLLQAAYYRNIPIIIANARISLRSITGYKILHYFISNIIKYITLVAAQSNEDGDRFLEIGLKNNQLKIIGNLKFDISISDELAYLISSLKKKWKSNRLIWIAGSTHDGEEILLVQAYHQLSKIFPTLLLIIVPRHPERFLKVKKIVAQSGLNYIMRSDRKNPSINTQVIIGDSIGELMLLYGIADLAFIGGSLVKDIGGHNPLEAAVHSIPIIMGPYIRNFQNICNKLIDANGLIIIKNIKNLIKVISILLKNKQLRLHYGCRAINVLKENQGALHRFLKLLDPYLKR